MLTHHSAGPEAPPTRLWNRAHPTGPGEGGPLSSAHLFLPALKASPAPLSRPPSALARPSATAAAPPRFPPRRRRAFHRRTLQNPPRAPGHLRPWLHNTPPVSTPGVPSRKYFHVILCHINRCIASTYILRIIGIRSTSAMCNRISATLLDLLLASCYLCVDLLADEARQRTLPDHGRGRAPPASVNASYLTTGGSVFSIPAHYQPATLDLGSPVTHVDLGESDYFPRSFLSSVQTPVSTCMPRTAAIEYQRINSRVRHPAAPSFRPKGVTGLPWAFFIRSPLRSLPPSPSPRNS